MKSNRNKKKIVSFLVVSFLVILGAFNLPFVYAIHMEGDGATFYPDDDHPVQYGVFIPEPNMYSTMYIDASNQGRFALMDWQGDEDGIYELVDFPGEDISELYPWYFDDYYKDTTTNNDFIDPWLIDWINVTTLNPHDITLSNYSINSVFNYYVLIEGGDLTVPLNHSIPIQIDVMIESTGPKILKTDWLTDDPSNIINENIRLISPSGKIVDPDEEIATSHAVQPPIDIFDYLTFVAHETGAYRLLVYAEHNAGKPAYLNLEFLSSSINSLPLETLKFGGNAEDILMIEEKQYSTWQSNWFRINGERGDIFRLQLYKDYATEINGVPIEPIISIWSPCEDGYILDSSIAEGIHDIYFPTKGKAYISMVDADYGNWYRYSLFLNKYESIDYNIGDNKTTIRLSRDEGKILDFSVQEDSFIRFNLTAWDDPSGIPELNYLGTSNAFIFQDSKKIGCYDEINPLHTETVDSTDFNYYYMPAGNYKGIFRNSDET
ncbi:MAG: hypothetical protein HWN81_02795, partial [Candidatus Lokiarchaeota archaeon]|nr:hypothetical protein [Candidatus Lokiarchaeota archaeon]